MALPKLARPGRARRQGSSVHIPGPGATKIQLQISVTRSASFPLPTNSPAAGGARPRHRLCERPALHIGSRAGQPVAAAAAPPGGRGSLSLLSSAASPAPTRAGSSTRKRWAPAAPPRRPRDTTAAAEVQETPRTPGLPPAPSDAAIGNAAYSTPKRWTSMHHSYRTMRDWSWKHS